MTVSSVGEEIANSITHGLGALLSIAGLVVMIVVAASHGTALQLVVCAVYGITLVMLYSSSTLYHALSHMGAKEVFRILDHSAIFLLIAGTYTPFSLVTLRGALGWSLFGVVWAMAVAGVVFKCFFTGRMHRFSTAIYVGMGWLAIAAIGPLLHSLPWQGFLLLVAGGIFYTSGVIFFVQRWRYAHAIWHLFVLSGSVCHFLAVLLFVIGPTA